MKHRTTYHLFSLVFSLSIFFSSPLYALLAETSITTAKGKSTIGFLKPGDSLIAFDVNYQRLVKSTIQAISSSVEPYGIAIHTQEDIFIVSPEQLVYDYHTKKFIPAAQLNTHSILVSKNGKLYPCIAIELYNEPAIFYDLHLKKPHTFFAFKQELLMHNMHAAAEAAILPLTEWIFGAGVAICCGYLGKKIDRFTEFNIAKNYLTQLVLNFADQCQKLLNEKKDLSLCEQKALLPPPQQLFPIPLDQELYRKLHAHPLLYGPLCCIANMQEDGNVECAVYVLQFDRRDLKTNTDIFSWKLLGRSTVNRDHPLVKDFVASQEAQELQPLKEAVQKWPRQLHDILFSFRTTIIKQTTVKRVDDAFFERKLNGLHLGIHAVYNMARRNISSWLIRYALHHGQRMQANYPNRCIIVDHEHNIAVVQENPSQKILNVGYFTRDMPQLNPPAPKTPPPAEIDEEAKKQEAPTQELEPDNESNTPEGIKTVEDILKDAKPGRETNGKSTQFEKPGGFEEALKDFESLKPENIRHYGEKIVGHLPAGQTAVVRPSSLEKLPTLEIQKTDSRKKIKIRYR